MLEERSSSRISHISQEPLKHDHQALQYSWSFCQRFSSWTLEKVSSILTQVLHVALLREVSLRIVLIFFSDSLLKCSSNWFQVWNCCSLKSRAILSFCRSFMLLYLTKKLWCKSKCHHYLCWSVFLIFDCGKTQVWAVSMSVINKSFFF